MPATPGRDEPADNGRRLTGRRWGHFPRPHRGTSDVHAQRDRRSAAFALADDDHVTVIELDTGQVLSTHHIEPEKNYWRNQNKERGRWPSPPKTRHMTRDT